MKYEINTEYNFIGECNICGNELAVTDISVHCNAIYIQTERCEKCEMEKTRLQEIFDEDRLVQFVDECEKYPNDPILDKFENHFPELKSESEK